MAKHTIREEMKWVVLFVGAIWVVFLLNCLPLPINLNDYGLRPRTLSGPGGNIYGAVSASRYLALGQQHGPVVCLAQLAGRIESRVALGGDLAGDVGGLLLWVGGQPAIRIGASGLVFGLIAYLISAGFFERRPLSILISVVVRHCRKTLFFGVLPRPQSGISWDGHLFGALAGIAVSYASARLQRANSTRDTRLEAKPKEAT